MTQLRHFIDILDHDRQFLSALIDRAIADKQLLHWGRLEPLLKGKTLAMYFDKASLRTQLSFEVAMTQLGGHAIYLTPAQIGLGKREPIKDVARVISGMCDGFAARTFSHETVKEFAEFASIPVINAMTDYNHPCQAMADLMIASEKLGALDGLKLTFIGDGNNVARSLAAASAKLGLEFVLAAPEKYQLSESFIARLRDNEPQAKFSQTDDPKKAAKDADIVYTDTWVSMGQEKQREQRIRDFQRFQVNAELLKSAKQSALVMHCLPAYRGYEITDEVLESERSVVFDEAENRLHLQRTLLAVLIGRIDLSG